MAADKLCPRSGEPLPQRRHDDGDFEVHATGTHKKLTQADLDAQALQRLVVMGLAVVEDFLPNIGNCALQDYGRLNDYMIEATRVQEELAKQAPG